MSDQAEVKSFEQGITSRTQASRFIENHAVTNITESLANVNDGKKFREELYEKGFAILQYDIQADELLARYRDTIYVILDKIPVECEVTEYGFKKCPLAVILSLPKTKEYNRVTK